MLSGDGHLAVVDGTADDLPARRQLELLNLDQMTTSSLPATARNPVTGTIAVSNHGKFVAWVSDNQVLISRVANGELKQIQVSNVGGMRFSSDEHLLTAFSGRKIYVFDTDNGRRVCEPLENDDEVNVVALAPDNSRLAAGSTSKDLSAKTINVWRLDNGEKAGPTLKHGDGVLGLAFNNYDHLLASASEDKTARLWDLATGQSIAVLKHTGQVRALAFSDDGRWLATASSGREARVWEPRSGEPLTPWLPYEGELQSISISPDKRHLIVSIEDGFWTWTIVPNKWPVNELHSLADAYGEGNFHRAMETTRNHSDGGYAAWRNLRNKYPMEFEVSRDEIKNWEESRLNYSVQEHQWNAAVFHLQQLLGLNPNNEKYREALDEMEAKAGLKTNK